MPPSRLRHAAPPEALRERIDRAMSAAVRETGAHVAGLYLTEPESDMLALEAVTGVPPEFTGPWARLPLLHPGPAPDAAREKRLVWLAGREDLAAAYPRTAMVSPYDFALAAVPVLAGQPPPGAAAGPGAPATGSGPADGVLVLMWPGTRHTPLTPREREVVTSAADRIGEVLHRAAGTGHPLRAADQPRVLPVPHADAPSPAEALAAVEFAQRLPEGVCSLDLNGRISFLTDRAADLLGERRERLLGALPWVVLPWLDDPAYEDAYRAAVVGGGPVTFTARRTDGAWVLFRLYPDTTGLSVLIGRVEQPSAEPIAEPSTEPSAGPAAASRDVGPATAGGEGQPPRPRVLTRARIGGIYHLLHLASALTEAADVEDVVERTANELMPAFGAQGFVLLAAEGDRLRVIGHRGYPDATMDRFDATPLSAPTPGTNAVTAGRPVFVGSREEMEQAYPDRPAMKDSMAAWAFLPLIASRRRIGACVLAYKRPHTFTAEQRDSLAALSGLIAQALERARLYDTKHRLAHALQTGLLPRDLPRPPGLEVAFRYLPATHGMDIGGDFYDLVQLGDTFLGAVIGDVQGHNVTAAALMGQVRTAVRAYAASGASPAEVLGRTNRLLTGLGPELFTSCLYVSLDLARHKAHMATAGHPPPVLRHPDGRTETVELPPGLLLGIDPDVRYTTTELPLTPGTLLALYTDGLIEVPDEHLDESLHTFARTLGREGETDLETLADTLLHGTRPEGERTDDIALLLLRPA
ncbi:SpoIIE family protein phosphatase [Streptomyces aidingensis]|uniref:protein-serine/threonine phosphatase n=1 Tax=Streptomyces aidingensis TaxID=910347 RepID=A0A1I1NZG5_9ACTN|nr:SpoIIE family protein phosphatase [Streptomyces aidingensis]SFD02875.1 Serine phosphatase RsbU, regulator of sigma subunit [Streptomyces aidingensis]